MDKKIISGRRTFFVLFVSLLILWSTPALSLALEEVAVENVVDHLLIGYSDLTHLPYSMTKGDFNGDGVTDLAVGMPMEDHPQAADTGLVSIFLGRSDIGSLPDPAMVRRDENLRMYGGAANTYAGYLLAAGDLNGDGYDDLAIVAQKPENPDYTTTCVYVVFGRANMSGDYLLGQAGDTTLARDGAAFKAVTIGDMNRDGRNDLILSDILTGDINNPPNDPSRPATGPNGAIYVVYGTANWEANYDLAVNSDLIITRNGGLDIFQAYSLAVGDVNHDTYGDLAIGVPYDDGAGPFNPADAGQVHLLYGSTYDAGPNYNLEDVEDVIFYGAQPNDRIGGAPTSTGSNQSTPLTMGDINNDGIVDLIIGAPVSSLAGTGLTGAGKVEVVYGSTSLPAQLDLTNADLHILYDTGTPQTVYTGWDVAVADVNGDLINDLVVSTPRAKLPTSTTRDGFVYVVFGRAAHQSPLYLNQTADIKITSPGAQATLGAGHMGASIEVADINDSGKPDLILGATEGYTDSVGWAAFLIDTFCQKTGSSSVIQLLLDE